MSSQNRSAMISLVIPLADEFELRDLATGTLLVHCDGRRQPAGAVTSLHRIASSVRDRHRPADADRSPYRFCCTLTPRKCPVDPRQARSRPRIASVSNSPRPTDLPVTATRSGVDDLADLDPFGLRRTRCSSFSSVAGVERLGRGQAVAELAQQLGGLRRLAERLSNAFSSYGSWSSGRKKSAKSEDVAGHLDAVAGGRDDAASAARRPRRSSGVVRSARPSPGTAAPAPTFSLRAAAAACAGPGTPAASSGRSWPGPCSPAPAKSCSISSCARENARSCRPATSPSSAR